MKKLIFSLLVFLGFAAVNTTQAQEVSDKTKVTSRETIHTTKKQIKEVTYQGITYYIFNSTWHTKLKNRYVFRNPPKGAKIDFRPLGGEYVIMHGKKYYKCGGIFYKELKDSIYEVVRI